MRDDNPPKDSKTLSFLQTLILAKTLVINIWNCNFII